ncbi:MAG: ATP-binding protein [Thermodesulfovibrionales bacterium]|nr:ATP-binding protein [Thermodesulfovibrionales bacterium]
MSGVRGLLYILFLSLLFLALIVAAVEWNDLAKLKAVSAETAKKASGLVTGLVKETVESGGIGVTDAYRLFEFAKGHGIHRIIIFDAKGDAVNDTLSRDLIRKKISLAPVEIAPVMQGEKLFMEFQEAELPIVATLCRISVEGNPYILSVMMELPHQEGLPPGTIIAFAAGGLFFMAVLFTIVRAYWRAQKRDLSGAAEGATEVGFVVDTFHGLVAALKEKERELEILRNAAEDKAAAIEGYNENILESVTSGVVSIDESVGVTKINSSAEKILEIKREDVLGKEVSAVFGGRIAEILTGRGTVDRGEMQYITPSGKRIWLGFTLAPLLDRDKNEIGRLFVFTDLTELKALESQAELRQRLSSLGEMAAGIAHELRNPMAVIAGYTKLLGRQTDNPIAKTVDAISKEVSVMDKIINDFLSFARPGEMKFSEVNLYGLIEESSHSLAAERQDIEVSIDMDRALAVKGDEILLRQAFTNLIQNSIEAMGGGGRVSVTAATRGGEVCISVSDTGHGIPEGVRDKIFLPFYTTKERGTGLGLAIVHRIVALHGGSIAVADTGGGTAFMIRLPKRD